jgi:lysozyme
MDPTMQAAKQPAALLPLGMRFSPAGLDLLKRFEGFRDRVYLDAAGLATIGYGHRVLPHEAFPDGITPTEAESLLAADVLAAVSAVMRFVKVSLTQGQFDALADFAYNLGAAKLAGSTLLAKLNAGDFVAAADQLLRWDHVGATELAGLKARREAEFALWHGSAASASAAA